MKKPKFDIPEKSIWYLFVCGAIILILLLVVFFPLYKYNSGIAREVAGLENQLLAQKELAPIYAALIKAKENKKEHLLPNPKRTKLSREEATKFPEAFKQIAQKSNLRMVSITPDLSRLSDGTPFLLQSAVLRGDIADFRKMLIELGAVPYMDGIEEISMQQLAGSVELKIKIRLAIGA
ncbi:MAG TPA: hypothetical protein ENN23_06300 [Deltaproteobacteria bacterium]|nr:hypothetical protein [Deltaproteobacteria bacterium]